MTGDTTIHSLTGVFHADGGVRGELAYVFGKIRGTAHCALCDITHRGVRRNPQWSDLVCELEVPFALVHLNERSPEVAAASGNATPCVLAHTDNGIVTLLGPDGLEPVEGDVTRLADALRNAAGRARLTWPAAPSPEAGQR